MANSGLPRLFIKGALRQARTFILVDLLGGKIPDGHQPVTTCEQKLCLSPDHLTNITRNQAMKAAANRILQRDPGHFSRLALKFTAPEREWIRRDTGTQAERAMRYGCSRWTIIRICAEPSIDEAQKPEPRAHKPRKSRKLPPQATSVFDYARTL